MSSTFGTLFRVSTFGESHGKAVGCMVDGCPPHLNLTEADLQPQLDRRRPGQSALTTPREEADRVEILSGTENGITLGTPIALRVNNKTQIPGDYAEMQSVPRPSHADYTYRVKYGINARSGGGRASARETIGRVAAGAIAEKLLHERFGTEIVAWVSRAGPVELEADAAHGHWSREEVDASPIRCPDPNTAEAMNQAVLDALAAQDSLGGVITCVCRQVPAGLGEPVFDKAEAMLAHAMLSIPAVKGFEIGSGFAGTRLRGSEHNDLFIKKGDRLGTRTNHSGGVQGGITNGEPILFRVAFKPAATIAQPQKTADFEGRESVLEARGRHDPCVLPRAVPIVETMAALTLADLALRQQSRA
jgi:chorismate synthase